MLRFVADVFDCILIDKNNDVVATTTLQSSDINVQVQSNDVRGGKNNNLLGILHSSRDIDITLTDVTFNFNWIAKQLGQTIEYKSIETYAMPQIHQVSSIEEVWDESLFVDEDFMYDENYTWDENDLARNFFNYLFGENDWAESISGYDPEVNYKGFLLNNVPVNKQSIIIYDSNGNVVDLSSFNLFKNFVELNTNIGDIYEVRTYIYMSPENSEVIEIDNSVFSSNGFKLILETIEIDNNEIGLNKIQYVFDRVILRKSFEVNTSSDRQQITQDIGIRIIKPKHSNKVGRVLRIPIN